MDDAGRLLGLRLLLRVVAHARRLRGLPAASAAGRDLGHAFTRFGRRRRLPQARSRAARLNKCAGRGAGATVVARGDGLRRRRRANLQGPRKDAAGAGGVALDVARRPPAGRRFLGGRRAGATVLAAPLSRRLAWTIMDEKYAHDMLFDRTHGAARRRLRAGRLVVVALDQRRRAPAPRAPSARRLPARHKRAASRRPAR